ncbi:WD40-repeat-containing domain protein [Tribonema minus]|uniref:WD40-repeat-containing domain protein n=1 Tax=Tribonema minus TaxID=303371 RepID=A0A836CPQ8_9STRA|nr:WD40-repeat-containing domain protein [Tribonema minus]
MQLGPLDKNSLSSGSEDETILVWDTRTTGRTAIHTLRGHRGRITSLLLSGAHLYSGAADGDLREWDWVTGEAVHAHRGANAGAAAEGGITALAGTRAAVVSAGSEGAVRAWRRLEPLADVDL